MKTDDMIEQLVGELRPVRRLASPLLRFGRWFTVAALCVGVGVAGFGISPRVGHALRELDFWIGTIATLGLALLSGMGAFVLSVPGAERRRWTRYLFLLPLGIWAGVVGYALWHATQGFTQWSRPLWAGWGCCRQMYVLAVIPAVLLFAMIRRAAPLRLGWVGVLALLAAAALAACGLQFICPLGTPLHVLVWHVAPTVMLGGVGVLVGRLVLRW